MDTVTAIDLFLDSCRARQLSANTIYGYSWALAKMQEEFPEELPIQPREFQQIFLRDHNLSPESLADLWCRLRTFWNWVDHNAIADNVMRDLPAPRKLPKLPRVLSADEIRQLLSAAPCDRDYAVLAVLLDTGMRIGELHSMERRKVTSNGVLVRGKVGERLLPITDDVRELALAQGNCTAIWTGLQGPLTVWGLQQLVRRSMMHAGLGPPKIGPHTLRHTFGMQYILNGGDVFSLQKIMGHSRVGTTMIYVNMSTELVARQHRKYSPMARLLAE